MSTDPLKSARILIVDDQDINVSLLERVLTVKGYTRLRGLTDPDQVLPTCLAWKPDLLLLDLAMPGLDGFGVLRQVRPQVPEGEYFPILVITADATPATRQRALSSGATDFVTKPIDNTEVALRIHNLLEARFLYLQLRDQNARLEETVRSRTREVQDQAALLDRARDAILVQDLAGRIRFWNQGAARLYGWP